MRNGLCAQQMPEVRIVNLAETVMRASHGCYSPGKFPSYGMEHGENPEVATSVRALVQLRLDYVTHSCQISAAVGVHDALGP